MRNSSEISPRIVALAASAALALGAGCPRADSSSEEAAPGAAARAPEAEEGASARPEGGSASDPDSEASERGEEPIDVVPFERAGAITAETTRSELAAHYGESQLEDAETTIGEGISRRATRVRADTPRALEVVWSDAEPPTAELVRVLGEAIEAPGGIRIGTPLGELADALGPFEVHGFEVDRALAGLLRLEDTDLARYRGGLQINLRATDTDWDHYQTVVGTHTIPHDDPHLEASEPVVDSITVALDAPEGP